MAGFLFTAPQQNSEHVKLLAPHQLAQKKKPDWMSKQDASRHALI
jgi:hypothetical protein